ncbi:MAG: hypothetical protein ACLR1T_13060 [Evtepia gabavorous]
MSHEISPSLSLADHRLLDLVWSSEPISSPSCASWPRHSWAGSAPPPTPSSSACATRAA